MKILFIIDDLNSGGAQRQLVYLAKTLKNEYKSIIEVAIYYPDLFYKNELLDSNIIVHELYSNGFLSRIINFRKLIRNNDYDTVISYLMAPNILNVLSAFPKKRWKIFVNERSANKRFSLKFFMIRLLYSFSDGIITNSNENMAIIKKSNILLKTKKSIVIYNSIDFDYFKPLDNFRFIKNGIVKIVVLSSHQYLKNLRGLIYAINLLKKEEKKKIKIFWYGAVKDTSLKQGKELVEKFKLKETFHFEAEIRDVLPIIQNADVIGLFSYYEGFPNAICEGMSCSKPVISSKVSDIPMILDNHEQFLFSPNQIDDILRVIRNILSFDNVELSYFGEKNFILAREKFNPKINTDKLFNFIQ